MPTANLTADFTLDPVNNPVVGHKVYTKTRWSDDWVEQRYLSCVSATWSIAPRMPTAELAWNYGRGKLYDLMSFANVLPDTGARRYVKIEWQNDAFLINGDNDNPIWYGMVNGVGTRQGGTRTLQGTVEHGQQVLQCVGLDKLLEDTIIRTAAWKGSDGNVYQIDRGLTFNEKRADHTPGGNRTSSKVGTTHVFSGTVKDDDAFWTTKDILEYLLQYHKPKDKAGVDNVKFALWPVDVFGTWSDKPYLPTNHHSLRELLNQLLPHQRMLSWFLQIAEPFVYVTPISLTGDNITLPNGGVLNANDRRWAIHQDDDAGEVSRVLSHAEAVDRVRVRGARARSVFSIQNSKNTLVSGWTSTQETDYEAGASGVSGYDSLSNEEKKRRNRIARGVDKLKSVYSRFKIPDDWDGGTEYSGGGAVLTHFCPIATETPSYKFYQRELYLLHRLPMRDGYNYQTLSSAGGGALPPVKVSDGPFAYLPPLVVFKVPGQTRYVQCENIGTAGDIKRSTGDTNYSWSANVHVPPQDRAIVINVIGDHQHIIAGADFTPLSGEPSQSDYGAWDWKEMIATVAAEWDAYCEGVYPTPSAVLSDADTVREVVLQAADTFHLDWLVPNTVIAIDSDGQLVRCTDGGWINDDRKKLEDRARMAYQWYGLERRAIQFSSGKVNGTLQPGDFVVSMGDANTYTVNSVISEIRIDCPLGMNGEPPPPRISYTTDFVRDFDLYLDGVATARHDVDRMG